MNEEMVMRSVYLRPSEDGRLRRLAFDHDVTKSDLIRSAISAKLQEWMADPSNEVLLRDLELGRRTPASQDPARVSGSLTATASSPEKKAPAGKTRKAETVVAAVKAVITGKKAPGKVGAVNNARAVGKAAAATRKSAPSPRTSATRSSSARGRVPQHESAMELAD